MMKKALFLLPFILGLGMNVFAGGRNIVSLNGKWDVALAADGQSDVIPEVFDHQIPVPGLWPLLEPAEEYGANGAMWYRKTYRAPKRLPPRVVLRIAKAEFGRTIFVNGKKAGFYPYNFSASETDIRPYLKPGENNKIVIRVKSAADAMTDGSPTAHNGSDYERLTYQMGLYDDISIIESGWPAVTNVETCADLERGTVKVRATLSNGTSSAVSGDVTFRVGKDILRLNGEELAAGEERQVLGEVTISGFDLSRDAWSPENPKLYTITAQTKGDAVTRRFGMRTFKVDSQKKCFLLNGEMRFLTGTNTDLFRFLDDPQCGSKPWDEQWMRQLFSEFKRIGWDSFRNCISAVPEMWYDLCDEMGLMIQDEYPFWVCGDRYRVHACPCTPETLLPEYTDWLRDRGTHPSIVIIDLQNESYQDWFIPLKDKLKALDFQRRPFEIGWTANNPDPADVRECHPYFFIKADFSLGYLNSYDGYVTVSGGVKDDGHPMIINEYGWNWLNRNGDPTSLSVGDYEHTLPGGTRQDRLAYYAWSVGILTEYWRTRGNIAGIHHFTSLTYSFDDAQRACTGDILCPDLSQPVIRPEVFDRFHSAFAPVTVVVDDYLEDVIAGREKKIPIVLLNESRNNQSVSRQIRVTLADSLGRMITEKTLTMAAEPHGRAIETIGVNIPETAMGTLVLTASTDGNISSVRRWKVLHRQPDYALGCPATASTEHPREHGGRPADCATDGSPLTRWLSEPGDAEPWLCIDLGSPKEISSCHIGWYADRGKLQSPAKVCISLSTDGTDFTTVASQETPRTAELPQTVPGEHPNFTIWQQLTFPPATARFIRIQGEGPLPAELMSVTEVEIR